MRAVLVCLLLAGCLAPADDLAVPDGQLLRLQGPLIPDEVAPGGPIQFTGSCVDVCHLDFRGSLPEGAVFAITYHWDGTKTTAAPGTDGTWQRGFDSLRHLTTSPTSSLAITGAVEGNVRILEPNLLALDGDRMLPNIVTYAPEQIHIGACDAYETSEQGATRCLRLGNAIGNTGDGPLQVSLPPEQGILAAADLGSFDQVIRLRSGGIERVPVGNADIHPTHAHFHYDGFAQFSLYAHDPETGLRGEMVAEHHKSGFCFLDWGPMEDPDRAPAEGGHADTACTVPQTDGWSMGVSEGWFDFYWAALTDQYINIPGVPDGTYELVSTGDWSDSLLETDETDNSASAIITLKGDSVGVLETRSFYTLPEDTRQL